MFAAAAALVATYKTEEESEILSFSVFSSLPVMIECRRLKHLKNLNISSSLVVLPFFNSARGSTVYIIRQSYIRSNRTINSRFGGEAGRARIKAIGPLLVGHTPSYTGHGGEFLNDTA
jgi:hypothetical protein